MLSSSNVAEGATIFYLRGDSTSVTMSGRDVYSDSRSEGTFDLSDTIREASYVSYSTMFGTTPTGRFTL